MILSFAIGIPALMVLCICGGFVALLMTTADTEFRTPPNVSTTPTSEIVVVSADKLFGDFETSRTRARRDYYNRVVEVSGIVRDIETYIGVSFVSFENGIDEDFSVDCQFAPEFEYQIQSIQPGDFITIRGRCTGKLFDVDLEDCRLVQ